MLGSVRRIIRNTDAATAGAYLSLFRERNALLAAQSEIASTDFA